MNKSSINKLQYIDKRLLVSRETQLYRKRRFPDILEHYNSEIVWFGIAKEHQETLNQLISVAKHHHDLKKSIRSKLISLQHIVITDPVKIGKQLVTQGEALEKATVDFKESWQKVLDFLAEIPYELEESSEIAKAETSRQITETQEKLDKLVAIKQQLEMLSDAINALGYHPTTNIKDVNQCIHNLNGQLKRLEKLNG